MAERKVVWTKTADLQLIGTLEYWPKFKQNIVTC